MNAVVKQEPESLPAPVSEGAAMIAMLERAARDPAVDIDKFERMMKMKQDIDDRRDRDLAAQAKLAFNRAMVECQSQLPQVVRNAENSQTHSVYATMDAIGEAIDPVIAAHGFVQSFGFDDCPKEGHLRIVCRTSHTDGHERTDHIDMPIDNAGPNGTVNKTKPHALSSTASYGRRILTCLIFNVKTKKGMPDDDGNAAGGKIEPTISEEQIMQLRDMLETDVAVKKFCAFAKLETLGDMFANKFDEAVRVIEQRQKAVKS